MSIYVFRITGKAIIIKDDGDALGSVYKACKEKREPFIYIKSWFFKWTRLQDENTTLTASETAVVCPIRLNKHDHHRGLILTRRWILYTVYGPRSTSP